MIVVSHRGPYRFEPDGQGGWRAHRGAGGVVSALAPLLAGRDDATWMAAALGEGDRAAAAAGVTGADGGPALRLLDIPADLHRMHYDVVSNATLWFLLHGLFDLPRRPRFDRRFREAWEAFAAVNAAFAEAVAELAAPDEEVLVHDYHLALVPQRLRRRRPDLAVVHFMHTPFCDEHEIRVLPADVAAALCASLAGGPVGFHTQRWAAAFGRAARAVLGGAPPGVFHATFGPDPAVLAAEVARPEVRAHLARIEAEVDDRRVIVRSDRMELSKNIVRGFLAFDTLLEDHPEWRERVTFVAMCNPSRESLIDYVAYRQEVETVVARINDRWHRGSWTPIVLDVRDDHARSLAAFVRADVLLVNPVRDGLNLVALEGPLCNGRDAVLCLSREAGAFELLADGALEVHPFDVLQTAEALARALDMPAGERSSRAALLRAAARSHPPESWLEALVERARRMSARRR